MKIESYNINMSGEHSLNESSSKVESLKVWVGNRRPDFEGNDTQNTLNPITALDTVNLSSEGMAMLENSKTSAAEVQKSEKSQFEISDLDKQKILALEQMIRALTGKKFKIRTLEKMDFNCKSPELNLAASSQQRQGWGLEYDSVKTNHESEKMSFKSDGMIKTSDGKNINFSITLNMSREFTSKESISIRAGDAVVKDPLVINFNGKAPSLTEQKFSFDIDSNGTSEQISFLSKDSGFLALDLNNDGTINNGSELFGPNSGNGFGELSKYDSDMNNWIDENDPVFDRLRIWTKDESGNDKLFALGAKGIGAIYLGNVDTSFSMNDSNNNMQGQVKKTGVFIRENGSAGTIQHIDLAI